MCIFGFEGRVRPWNQFSGIVCCLTLGKKKEEYFVTSAEILLILFIVRHSFKLIITFPVCWWQDVGNLVENWNWTSSFRLEEVIFLPLPKRYLYSSSQKVNWLMGIRFWRDFFELSTILIILRSQINTDLRWASGKDRDQTFKKV